MSAGRRKRAVGSLRLGSIADRSTALAAVVAGLLVLVIASPSLGDPQPGDPAAFVDDARFHRCGGDMAPVRYAFEIAQARRYRDHLPRMPRTRDLARDEPALVVVFAATGPFVSAASAPPGAASPPGPTPDPSLADVCIYVGAADGGQLNYYREVPIGGLRLVADGPTVVPLQPGPDG